MNSQSGHQPLQRIKTDDIGFGFVDVYMFIFLTYTFGCIFYMSIYCTTTYPWKYAMYIYDKCMYIYTWYVYINICIYTERGGRWYIYIYTVLIFHLMYLDFVLLDVWWSFSPDCAGVERGMARGACWVAGTDAELSSTVIHSLWTWKLQCNPLF